MVSGKRGPVGCSSKCNQMWLQKHPVHRDSAIFNVLEVENGPASRKMKCKIQKWNVKVHPILVANAHVVVG